MRRIILALYTISFIACSGNHSETASTSTDTKSVDKKEPVAARDKDPVPLTDKEKAQITDEFLVLNAKEIRDNKSDDCDMLTKSLQLLYARQIIFNRFPGDAPASSDINDIINILENKITAQACTANLGGDITFGVKTSGGQVEFMKKMPVSTIIWSVLNDDQRALVLQSVPPETKNQLLIMESKYSTDIRQIKETPTVKTIIQPGAFSKREFVKPHQ
jgi:hypothetical protein